MKKKGFTLVELLAVIAILAILVLLALPNVLDLFNDAKKNAFKTEAESYFKAAQSQYVLASTSTTVATGGITFETGTSNKLEMSGEQLNYKITLNAQGKITAFCVDNGVYIVDLTTSSTGCDTTSGCPINAIDGAVADIGSNTCHAES